MNNLFKISVIILLLFIAILLATTSYKANGQKINVCPTNAISMQNGKAVIDPIKCIGCGRCALGIPNPLSVSAPAPQPQTQVDANPSLPQPEQVTKPIKTEKNDKPVKTVTQKVSKAIYKVTADLCIACELCVNNCPVKAITMIDGKAVIDQTKCTACGICVNGNGGDFSGCPTNAIKVTTK